MEETHTKKTNINMLQENEDSLMDDIREFVNFVRGSERNISYAYDKICNGALSDSRFKMWEVHIILG